MTAWVKRSTVHAWCAPCGGGDKMTKAKDPVCGMTVDTEKARVVGVYNGVSVYFCAEGCKKAYEADQRKK